MIRKRGLIILLALVSLNACAGSRSDQGSNGDSKIRNVSAKDLMKPETIREYENRKIRFEARFDKIESGSDWKGLEQYRTTHFLLSLISEDNEAAVPDVLVPAFESTLTKLNTGDLVQIEGVIHTLPEEGVYILASKIDKI